jgi:hypothetical protein
MAKWSAEEDPLGLVFGALGFGLTLGLALQSLVGFVVRTMQQGQPPPSVEAPDLVSASALVLLGGTLFASLAAALATWTVLVRLNNPFRQGMLAMVAAFGSLVLALVAMPVDRLVGRPGLLALALIAGLTSLLIHRRLRTMMT